MDRKIAVLQALAPARVGGLESVVTSLVRELGRRGHEVHVAVILEPGIEDHEFLEAVSSHAASVCRLAIPRRAYHVEVRRLRGILADLQPDVLHTHGYRADVVAGTVGRWQGTPVVSTVHGFTGGDLKNRLYERLQIRALRSADGVAAVSGPIHRRLLDRGLDPYRVRLIRNAWARDVDPEGRAEARARLGLPDGAVVAGWVGRLSREKGPDVFVEAMGHAGLTSADVVASVVGEGPLRGGLEERVGELGLAERVRFHGRVAGAAELYRAFDVFVLSSRTEGTPVSLLEAMEAEVPVVATRVGGVPDVVRHEREALLVPPEDPVALAEAVDRVVRHPGDAAERARRAGRRLEAAFDPETWLDSYEELYADVAGGP